MSTDAELVADTLKDLRTRAFVLRCERKNALAARLERIAQAIEDAAKRCEALEAESEHRV